MPKTIYVDFVNGADNKNGTSYVERVKTLAKADNLAAAGDTIRVMGSLPSKAAINALWTCGSPTVTLSKALTKSLYLDGAWTSASANITASAATSSPLPRQGTSYAKFVASGFTTGKVAYLPLGSAVDLSRYQQISLWLGSGNGLNSGRLRLDLCSDTTGDTIVHSVPVNIELFANKWAVMTVDLGQPMSDSIQSLRLTATASINNKTIFLDNVIASKAPDANDCLTLSSLISPDGNLWYHIQSINDTTVLVDGSSTSVAPGAAKGYQGDTVTANLQLLQPTIAATGASNAWAQTFADSGNASDRTTVSGGWDPFDMASQTGLTVIDRMDGGSSALRLTGNAGYVTVDGFAFVRCLDAMTVDATANMMAATKCVYAGVANLPDYMHGMTYSDCAIVNCGDNISIAVEGEKWLIERTKVWGCAGVGIGVTAINARIRDTDAAGNGSHGFDVAAKCKEFSGNSARKNLGRGFSMTDPAGVLASNLRSIGNSLAEVYLAAAGNNEINGLDTNTPGGSSVPQIESLAVEPIIVKNWKPYTGSSPAATMYSLGSPGAGRVAGRSLVSRSHQGEAAKNNIYSEYGLITTDGADSYNGSGLGWKFQPNANAFATSPLRLLVSRVPCAAGVSTTITHYAKRSGSGISARFRIAGGRYPGVGAVGTDVVANVTSTSFAAHNLTFTPTENCVVEVYFEAWGSTSQFATVSGPLSLTQNAVSGSYVLAPGQRAEPAARGVLQATKTLNYIAEATPYFVSEPTALYTYDKLGRLVMTQWANGQSQSVAFDTMGNRTSLATS